LKDFETCDKSERVKLSNLGLGTLHKCSDLRGGNELSTYLAGNPSVVYVHAYCRLTYTSQRQLEQEKRRANLTDDVSPVSKVTEIMKQSISVEKDCLFCCKPVVFDPRHPDRYDGWIDGSMVRTLELRKNIVDKCKEWNDDWAVSVNGRLNAGNDMIAEKARYHRHCPPMHAILL